MKIALLAAIPLAAAALAPAAAMADEFGQMDEFRQMDAHVHGAGRLAFVADGAVLAAELETPLANLIGFEHAPRNDAERQAYTEAVAWLSDPFQAFGLPRAGCEIQDVTVTEPDFAEAAHDHDHDHSHDHDRDHAHADLRIEYVFACSTLSQLRQIPVALFGRFPGFTRIDAVFVGERSYTGALTPQAATLDLRE